MASYATYSAIKDHLIATFSPGGVQVIDFDQLEPTLQQGTDPFLVLEGLAGDEVLMGIGDPTSLCFRETDTLDVLVFHPAPESSEALRLLADQVRDALRLQKFPGVRIVQIDPPILNSLNESIWSVATVSVEAVHDFHFAMP